jgi:hypothetical protein
LNDSVSEEALEEGGGAGAVVILIGMFSVLPLLLLCGMVGDRKMDCGCVCFIGGVDVLGGEVLDPCLDKLDPCLDKSRLVGSSV